MSLAPIDTTLAPMRIPKRTYLNFALNATQVSHKVIEEGLNIWARTLLGIAPLRSKRHLMSKAWSLGKETWMSSTRFKLLFDLSTKVPMMTIVAMMPTMIAEAMALLRIAGTMPP